MTEQEDTRRKARRDLLLVLLILPLGVLCMFMTGQVAIRLAPSWVLNADMRSLLDPNATFAAEDNPLFIEPINPGILTLPAWGDLFLTPNAVIPTRVVLTDTPPPPVRTPQPPPAPVTPGNRPEPTATVGGPVIQPTHGGGPLQADLQVEISDNSRTYTPGTSINYTILVTNLGPNDASQFNVIVNIPAVITGLTINCTPASLCGTNTSSGNNISFTGAILPHGGVNQITITVSGIVAPGATGDLVSTVSVVLPNSARIRDPNPANNIVTDTDTQLSIYDLAITKSDRVDFYTATNPITYTIVVTNNSGPSDALGVQVTDTKSQQIASWTWTCTTVTNASGCSGVTNSTNNFTNTVNIQPGGRIEYSVTANLAVLSQNPQFLSNTVNIVLPAGPEFSDPNLVNNSAADIDIPIIDLQITKDDGVTAYTPGGSLTYTVTVTNNSTFNLTGITVSDPKPPQVVNWTWCITPPCPAPITTDFTNSINLAAGSSLVYIVTANISGVGGGTELTNTATVAAPAGLFDVLPGNNSATDIDTFNLNVDLQITKDDGVLTYNPGGVVNYTVVVTNNSAIELNGAIVTDTMPSLVSSWTWTCAPAPGASCTPGPSSGNINDTVVNLPAGAAATYSITATVNGAAVGDLSNTATVSPPSGFVDAVPGNNTATDTDVNAIGEPDIGPPDGNIYAIPDGGIATFYLSQPIIANGDPAADFVFYELPMPPGIHLDQAIVEISLDGVTWRPVFFWGDSIADTNTNVDNINLPNIAAACPTEVDNCQIQAADLYPYPGTGIAIDVDNSPLSAPVPLGNYSWIRFTEPGITPGDGTHVDAIEILP